MDKLTRKELLRIKKAKKENQIWLLRKQNRLIMFEMNYVQDCFICGFMRPLGSFCPQDIEKLCLSYMPQFNKYLDSKNFNLEKRIKSIMKEQYKQKLILSSSNFLSLFHLEKVLILNRILTTKSLNNKHAITSVNVLKEKFKSNNRIAVISVTKYLEYIFRKNDNYKRIHTLCLDGYDLDNNTLRELCDFIKYIPIENRKNIALRTLNMNNNPKIDNIGFNVFLKMIQSKCLIHLKELNIRNIGISKSLVSKIVKIFKKYDTICVDISECKKIKVNMLGGERKNPKWSEILAYRFCYGIIKFENQMDYKQKLKGYY
eukprot:303384_1